MPGPSLVGVTITETGTGSSKTIQIQVSQEPINLQKHGSGLLDIEWHINSIGGEGKWAFDATRGIVIDDPGGRNFDHHGPISGSAGKHFKCSRKPSPPTWGNFKYSISVTDGTQTVVLDPNIINQP